MRITHGLVAIALAGGACKSRTPPEADNTQRNERDRQVTPTADQAAQTGKDLELTQKIRQGIMGNEALSTNAKNAKIIVESGVATLVGPVETADEKSTLESIAMANGATRVVNQLEVTNTSAHR